MTLYFFFLVSIHILVKVLPSIARVFFFHRSEEETFDKMSSDERGEKTSFNSIGKNAQTLNLSYRNWFHFYFTTVKHVTVIFVVKLAAHICVFITKPSIDSSSSSGFVNCVFRFFVTHRTIRALGMPIPIGFCFSS